MIPRSKSSSRRYKISPGELNEVREYTFTDGSIRGYGQKLKATHLFKEGDCLLRFVQLADSYFEKVVELTKEIVSTPSVSGEERELANKILSILRENEIHSFIDEVGNVIGILENGGRTYVGF